jgi:hypothetical protein
MRHNWVGPRSFAAFAVLLACGGHRATPPSYVRYRNGAGSVELRLSSSGRMAAMNTMLPAGAYEIRLWQREPYEQMVARGQGTIVGVPSDQDVLVIDDEHRIRWLRGKHEAKLRLPADTTWRFIGATTDEASQTAILAFSAFDADNNRVVLLDLDTVSLKQRGLRELVASVADSCAVAGRSTTLYLWCVETDSRWTVTRTDRLATTWTAAVTIHEPFISTEMRGQVTGDASALVLLYGLRETSRRRFGPRDIWSVDAKDGRVAVMSSREPLYDISSLTPVPGRPEIAALRWLYRDFYGAFVFDVRAGSTHLVIEPTNKLSPYAVAVLPDGRLLVP